MANEEQVALLKQGSEVWNKWREDNPDVAIDLSYAYLGNADLRGANLKRADLVAADLVAADLSGVCLSGADLSHANLMGSNLIGSNLSKADLSNSILSMANIGQANLSEALFIETKLIGASFSQANLSQATFIRADLSEANLSKANLRITRFLRTDLGGADLANADLTSANLRASQVLHTKFTDATLTGACVADLQIGRSTNLEGVKCDYIFQSVSPDGQFTKRCPVNPNKNFEPGEFTILFQVSHDTVELIFQRGMNWEAFAYSFNETNTKVFDATGQELYLKKYEVLGNGLVRLEVTVPPVSDKQAIHDNLEEGYEQRIAQLQGQYEKNIARLEGKLESKAEDYQQLLRVFKPGDTYVSNSYNQNFYGTTGNVAGANHGKMQNIQHIYAPEQQDLSEAAQEIQKLLNTLAETYNTTSETGQAKLMQELGEEIEKHPKWRRALKEGGIELIKVLCAPIGIPLEMARVYLEDNE